MALSRYLQPPYEGFRCPGKEFELSSEKIKLGEVKERVPRGSEGLQLAWGSSLRQVLLTKKVLLSSDVHGESSIVSQGLKVPRPLPPPSTFRCPGCHTLGLTPGGIIV